MTIETDRRVRVWEQHGQSIMLAVITGVLAYSANALVEAKTAQASMITEVRGLSAQVQRLEGAVTAMQLQYVTRGEFAVHEQRIQKLESAR